MPFESQEQQREVRQSPSQDGLSARTFEYLSVGNINQPQKNANDGLVAKGVLTNLQIHTESDLPPRVETVSGASAADYGTTELTKNYYASGIVLNPDQDLRTTQEKFTDFADAAACRLMAPHSLGNYLNSERDKFEGIGEGLNIAKEKTKASAVAAWNAVADGSVANFLAKPNAINEPLFGAVGSVIEEAKDDPNATNKLLVRMGQALNEASEQYSKLPSKEQGKFIGETMFGCTNLEGSTEAAEAALIIADKVATHVDARVMNAIEKSVEAIEKLKSASPEIAQKSKEMLYEYVTQHRIGGPQLEYAGVPKNYFDSISRPSSKGDNFYAMSKSEGEDAALRGKGELKNENSAVNSKGETALVEGINYRIDTESGRLQRVDLGELREPYEWPFVNEKFDSNCVRQSVEGACMSAAGEMVSNGRLTEAQLITHLGIPGNISELPALLGPEWTSEAGPRSLAGMDKGGSWVAQMYEGEFRPKPKQPHIVVVDGPTPDYQRLKIRDPQEGTSYEMTLSDFKKAWNGQAAYRRVE